MSTTGRMRKTITGSSSDVRKCHCGLATFEKISCSKKNPGLPYFNCPNYPHGCKFFVWKSELERVGRIEHVDVPLQQTQSIPDLCEAKAEAAVVVKNEYWAGFAMGLAIGIIVGFSLCAYLVIAISK